MFPLYRESCFTFRFADDPIIPRIHLEGIERVAVFQSSRSTRRQANGNAC
jgi:hypothetical protein